MRIVDQAEFETVKADPAFRALDTWIVVSVLCSYCDQQNTLVAPGNENCRCCGADLKKGKLLVGFLGNDGIFLDLDL